MMSVISHEFALADLEHMLELKVKLFFSTQTHEKFNFIGRILGRKGENLQAIESDCQCRISILGRGSLRSQENEGQLGNVVGYEHLKENLHLLVIANAPPQQAFHRLAKAITILKPYLHPDTAVNVQSNYKTKNPPLNLEQNLSFVPSLILNEFHQNESFKKLTYQQIKSSETGKRFQNFNLPKPNQTKPYSRPPRKDSHQLS